MRRSLVLFLLSAMVAASGLAFAAPQSTDAATKSVRAWIDLSATTPEIGCPVDISVEVREEGEPVGNAEVELALHVDTELVSADVATTDSSGIAYLALDTSAASADTGHWLDVLVGGEYLTGVSMVPSSSGGCDSGSKLLEVTGDVNIVPVAAPSQDSAGADGTGSGASVPNYVQQRNLSCEYAALYIATAGWGNAVSEYAFDDVVGYSANPHVGYRGDINGWWGNTDDYGVYAEALSSALGQFGYYGDAFYGGGSSVALTNRLDAGIPVLVWLSLWGDQSVVESDGNSSFTLVAGEHVVVAYDYDEAGVYASDPATGTYRFYAWGDFMYYWNVLDGMGLGVSPG